MEEENRKEGFTGHVMSLMERFTGDKVIFLIALFLMLISIISLFSSTSRLASDQGTDRMSIMLEQVKWVAIGFGVILALYFLGRPQWYRKISMLGFFASFACLFIVALNLSFGSNLHAGTMNGARRLLVVFGQKIHIYEFVKLFMIMYLGWALDSFKKGEFKWLPRLAAHFPKLAFLKKDIWQKVIYIYTPILLTVVMVSTGSNSSAIFMGIIMILMVLVGGLDIKDVAVVGAILLLAFGLMFGAYKMGLLQKTRLATLVSRFTNDDEATMQILVNSEKNTKAWQEAKDELSQPVGALLAIKEGGLLGKGIGYSTQKYQVPVIFSDYMFSFIVEETGLWGALILILLYFSLLARGTLVAKMCNNYYDKMIVAGLIILVTGQAFMHMAVNVHLPFIPQTGQTLPLVSHGANSFLVFAMVFGILLSISRDARENMEKKEAEADANPIIEHSENWTQDATS
ncbi:MAG: FtsW/RodA/SpoVE family cell cycle protein [Bacteroidales bacterium]|nr:FtsW/RodA/SpoVE family cell cycle protein [Bacteroidales bacterium]